LGIVGFSFLGIGSLVVAGYQAPWSPNFNPQPLPAGVTQNLTGDAAQGAQLFQRNGCINCHMIAGDGGRRGPDLTAVGSRVNADQLTTRILNGGANMPAYGDKLTANEVRALVAFLSQRK
jgi:ubiquinol-cytochrome c reductase cytochrome b subunit